MRVVLFFLVMGVSVATAQNTLSSVPHVYAQGVGQMEADPVDDWARETMEEHSIPGMAIGLFCRGEVLRYGTYGYANLEHQVPVTLDTRFQTGSVGKQFTSALIQLLARDGRLSLQDPVSRYIDNTPEGWSGMTIYHLLTHTSGLGPYSDEFDFRLDWSEDDLVDLIRRSELRFEPGNGFYYSNYGYILLGVIAGKVGGKHWGELARDMIFEPTGMATAQMLDGISIVPHRAAGYSQRNGEIVNEWWVSPVTNSTADGSLYVTIKDMAAWDHALTHHTVLTAEELEDAWTRVTDATGTTHNYGYGWRMSNREGRDYVYHGGNWQGFTAMNGRDRTGKLTVVILTNREDAPIGAMTIALRNAARATYAAQGATACAD